MFCEPLLECRSGLERSKNTGRLDFGFNLLSHSNLDRNAESKSTRLAGFELPSNLTFDLAIGLPIENQRDRLPAVRDALNAERHWRLAEFLFQIGGFAVKCGMH